MSKYPSGVWLECLYNLLYSSDLNFTEYSSQLTWCKTEWICPSLSRQYPPRPSIRPQYPQTLRRHLVRPSQCQTNQTGKHQGLPSN